MAAVLLVLGVLSLQGTNDQEATQLSIGIGVASRCIVHLLLFPVVLFGFRSRPDRPGIGIRVEALAAFFVALHSFVFTMLPLGEVPNQALFGDEGWKDDLP